VSDIAVASEVIEAKTKKSPEQCSRINKMTPDSKRNYCDEHPQSACCGKGESKPKEEEPKQEQQKPSAPAEGEKKPEMKPETKPEEDKKEEKKPEKEEKSKGKGTHPSELGDGPFDFESRKEEPLSSGDYDKVMANGTSGLAMMLRTMGSQFAPHGKEDLFEKRTDKGAWSQEDTDAVSKIISKHSDGKKKYDADAALREVTDYLFKPVSKEEPKQEKKPEAPKEKVESPKEEPKQEKTPEVPKEEKKPEAPKKEEDLSLEKDPDEENLTLKEDQEPESSKTEQPSSPAKTPFDNVTSQGKHHLFDSPMDFKDTDGMTSKGFREPKPGNHKISDNSVIVDHKTGDRYKFGDLPKKTQDKIKEVVESKGAWIAPKKKEEKPGLLKSLGKSLATGLGKAIGWGAGKGVNMGKHVRDFFKENGPKVKKKFVDTGKTIGDLLEEMMSSAKESYGKTKKSSIEDRVVLAAITENIVREAARGVQTKRKNKDMMQDTGGDSKGRQREPWVKPPREDLKNRTGPKHLKPSDRDKDTHSDPDMKLSFDEEVEEAMILM
jgi:hypothetical protein